MTSHGAETTSSLTNEQFWNLYLAEHQRLTNCWLHVIGTLSSWVVMLLAIVWQLWWLLILVPVVGYGMAWMGHLLIEGNQPVSIRYPVRSLFCDYRLVWQMLTGGRRGAVTVNATSESDAMTPASEAHQGELMSASNTTESGLFPLPLTAFEQLMLADDSRLYPMTFFIQIGLTGDLRREEFEAACAAAVHRHPLLMANVRWKFLRPYWVRATRDTVVQWHDASLPEPSLEQRYIDLKAQPALRVSVAHVPAESIILFQFHHAATDGIGAIQFIGDALSIYGDATAEPDAERPRLVPIEPSCLLRRGERWESGRQPPKLLRRWAYRVVEVLGVHPCRIVQRSNVPIIQQQGRPIFLTRFLERAELKALNQTAAARGVTPNELLALAMFQTLHTWNQHAGRDVSREVFRIAIPASVRTPVHDECPAANIVSYILLTRRGDQIQESQSLLNFIAAESRQVLNGRETGIVLLCVEAASLIPGLTRLLTRLPVRLATTVLANVGEVKRQLRNHFPLRRGNCVAGNVELNYLLGAAPVRRGTHVATSVGKYAGRLIINLNCDPQYFTADAAETFAECFVNHLRQLSESSEKPLGHDAAFVRT